MGGVDQEGGAMMITEWKQALRELIESKSLSEDAWGELLTAALHTSEDQGLEHLDEEVERHHAGKVER